MILCNRQINDNHKIILIHIFSGHLLTINHNKTHYNQQHPKPSSTTSFLTATTLVYAIGAGITAAAGTRLALQWVLVNRFKLYSFQLPVQRTRISMYCHYLPISGLGNLRACCLPWKWWPSLRPPLRNRTLIPRYPLSPRLSNTQPSKVDRAET